MLCLLSLLVAMGAEAQEVRNVVYTTGINELQYTKKESKPTAGEVIGEVLSAIVTGETTQEMDKYVDAVQAAVVKGISQARRVKAIDGQLTPEEKEQPNTWYVDGTIASISATSKVETWEDKDSQESAPVVALAELPTEGILTQEPATALTIRTRKSTIEISTAVSDTLMVELVKAVAHAL